MTRLIILFSFLMCLSGSLNACSLAIHDWQPLFHAKIPVSAPIFPFAELSTSLLNTQEKSAAAVFWVADHTQVSFISAALLPVIYGLISRVNSTHFVELTTEQKNSWLAKTPWFPVISDKSAANIAHVSAQSSLAPIVIGSDNSFFRIGLFSDANASHRAFQLVLMQESRARIVHANPHQPWAQESNATSFISLIFYELPLPGRIMSFSLYPIAGERLFFIESEELISVLLNASALKPRPVIAYEPESYNLPEFPE